MKKLSRMLQDVERIKETGGHVCKEGASPLFNRYCDFYYIFDKQLEKYKRGNGKDRDIPVKLMGLFLEAYALGASAGLATLKHGLLLRDEAGNVVDRAFYSLEELLNEAEALSCPDCQAEVIEERLDALEQHNDDEDCDCEDCDCDEELF